MKKVILITVLALSAFSTYSQESGILKDTLNSNAIYLSQDKMVSNDDYPNALKAAINEYKTSLNQAEAEEIIRASLILLDSLEYTDVAIENGLKINLYFKIADQVISEKTLNNLKTTTYSYHLEKRPIFVPFDEIRFLRIKSFKDHCAVDFVTKVTLVGQGPYYGNNKFQYKIKTQTDEVALIASLLYVCKNIKNSGLINY